MNKLEFAMCAVNPDELKALGRSRWFHIDRQYMAHVGCRARVVVCGWGIEVWG